MSSFGITLAIDIDEKCFQGNINLDGGDVKCGNVFGKFCDDRDY